MKKTATLAFWIVLTVGVATSTAFAQTGGGGTGGGGTGGGGTGGGGTGGTGGGTGGTGGTGGGPAGDFTQQELNLGGADFRFDDIRRPRFAGVSRSTVVHPFTRVGNSEALQIEGNSADAAGAAGGAGGAAGTQANTRQGGNVAGTNQFATPFGQFGGFGGFGGQFGGFGGFGGLGGQQTPVRSSLSFNTEASSHLTAPTRQALEVPVRSQPLVARVRSIPGLQFANVSVELLNRTAIVSGIVLTEEEKQRVTRVLKLESGVSEVDNRLEVRR